VQARFHNRTTMTNVLGFVDLEKCWTGVSDREEQLRIHVTAGGVMAPVHEVTPSGQVGRTEACPVSCARLSKLVNDFTSDVVFQGKRVFPILVRCQSATGPELLHSPDTLGKPGNLLHAVGTT
jgi:hypothetical protein